MPQEIKKMKPKRSVDSAEHRLRAIATVMVVSLLLVIGILAATSSSKGNKGAITAQTTTSQAASSQPAASSSTIESVLVPPLSIYRRRNIFQPLINMDAGQTQATTTGGGVTGGGATGGGATGAADAVITLPPELDASGGAVGSVVSTAVTLDGVFSEGDELFARIRIGDQLFDKVAVGDVFGNNYKLLALGKDDSSATVLYGDERFTIFTGQSLYL